MKEEAREVSALDVQLELEELRVEPLILLVSCMGINWI